MRNRVALAAIAAVAALGYAWALYRDPLEPYYAAAVQSMAGDWRDFAFGAFDPAGTVTLDKLPGAFWVQALAVRLLGLHTWTQVLPQVIEGVLTVLVLHRAVTRSAGPAAGLVAALAMALSPAVVAANRGNISDPLMILLVVLAADATVGAIRDPSARRVVLAGVWVGLAFQAKMLEAWLVLPALGVAYLVAAATTPARRFAHLVAGGMAAAAVSLAWMVAVSLAPAGNRPYVDGGGSLFAQVFAYNGVGRLGEQTPLQILAGQGLGVAAGPPPGWARLLTGDLGRDTGWLLPAALVAAVALLVARRREPRTDPVRAAVLLWGGWAVTLGVAFSTTGTINSYYTAALAPALAALCGIGLTRAAAHRAAIPVRVTVAVAVAATAIFAVTLLSGAAAPGWLVPALAVLAVAAVALLAAGVRAGAAVAAAAVLVVPAVASAVLVAGDRGAFDTPFEAEATERGVDQLFVATPQLVARSLPTLEKARAGAPDLLAVQSSAVASVFAYPSGQEVLPIGGFTGTQPRPTLDELRADIARGEFHLVLTFPSTDPRVVWISQHCRPLNGSAPPLRDYLCTPADAA